MSETYRKFDPWRVPPVQEDSRQQILDAYYFSVEKLDLSAPNFGHFSRTILREKMGDTVAVLALTDDKRIPFVEQYRIPTHRWTLEIPAGHANSPDEKPADVAARKLREEAGLESAKMSQIYRFINTPSFSTQHTALFLARDLSHTKRTPLGPESGRSSVRYIPLDEAYAMVNNGTILDAKTIIAVLAAMACFAS
ncbi:MAG: NUDIX hydrolase [Bifidobacteriaceae bacterium]|jgi:ADP-ribose pyrophosphatase|nr:NUDIX hydrolase [Bifidobacteriaceae bacterium]